MHNEVQSIRSSGVVAGNWVESREQPPSLILACHKIVLENASVRKEFLPSNSGNLAGLGRAKLYLSAFWSAISLYRHALYK